MPTETLPSTSPMARALRSANLHLAASLAASNPHTDIITRPVTATGLTPLHLATILHDAHLVDLLLSSGAVPDPHALILAAQAREPQILTSLITHSPEQVLDHADEAVHAAAWAGSTDCVRVLVESGIGVEWRAGDGATPICCAVIAGDHDMVECLLASGANVTGLGACGVSVEEWARRLGGTVKQLVIEQADKQRRRGLTQHDDYNLY